MKLVLFVHQSAEMYGSDKVLLLLTQGLLCDGRYFPVVVLPDEGPLRAELVKIGVEVHVGEVAKLSRAAFSPIGLLKLMQRTVRAVKALDGVVDRRAVALVHSNTLAVLGGAAWALLRRKRHLWHVHEIILKPKLANLFFPFIVKHLADIAMSNSTLTERWLIESQPRLAPRSAMVYNGLPPVKPPTQAAIDAFRASVHAGLQEVVITVAGRINRWKGQELLLKAVGILNERGHAGLLRIAVVGGPAPGLEDLPDELARQAEAMGISNICTFLPFVSDIWPVWFGTDIAVVPSTEPEPFGMVAIEAMAAGRPVIAAGHGGLLDIVVDGVTGVLFPPCDAQALADAIYRLAQDRSSRTKLGMAAIKRQIELFSVVSQVEKTIATYEEMI